MFASSYLRPRATCPPPPPRVLNLRCFPSLLSGHHRILSITPQSPTSFRSAVFPPPLCIPERASFDLGREFGDRGKMSGKMEGQARSILNDLNFDKGNFLDLGHPLLNRIAESFVKAAGIGAIQAVTRETYFTAVEGAGLDSGNGVPDIPRAKKRRFPELRGETNSKSLEAMVKRTGKESLQWGLAAGVYSGLTYGLKEARGAHDWKNSAIAGAITGVALALTADDSSHEQVVQCAITGAAISTAANLLTGIF